VISSYGVLLFLLRKKKTSKMQCEDRGVGQWLPVQNSLEKRRKKDDSDFRTTSSTIKKGRPYKDSEPQELRGLIFNHA
jgi:hypothetical protein